MKNIYIISGGPGKEHEISVLSGENCLHTLQQANIECQSIIVSKEKEWVYKDKKLSKEEGVFLLKENNALVFQLIHGTYGEDGELTSLLEENNISFIGSGTETMQLTIDKYKTEKFLEKKRVPTTHSLYFGENKTYNGEVFGFPVFIKPKSEGSSVGLYKVDSKEELIDILEKAIPIYKNVLVQEYIKGREFTCGVIEIDGETRALIPSEVVLTQKSVFDYDAKYKDGGAKEITPAQVDPETIEKIQDLAKQVHEMCGCKDISRTDMIMKENGELVVLEINTIPGMTKMSFIPAEMKASRYSLLDFIVGM